jgi:hypothetical protein
MMASDSVASGAVEGSFGTNAQHKDECADAKGPQDGRTQVQEVVISKERTGLGTVRRRKGEK